MGTLGRSLGKFTRRSGWRASRRRSLWYCYSHQMLGFVWIATESRRFLLRIWENVGPWASKHRFSAGWNPHWRSRLATICLEFLCLTIDFFQSFHNKFQYSILRINFYWLTSFNPPPFSVTQRSFSSILSYGNSINIVSVLNGCRICFFLLVYSSTFPVSSWECIIEPFSSFYGSI